MVSHDTNSRPIAFIIGVHGQCEVWCLVKALVVFRDGASLCDGCVPNSESSEVVVAEGRR